MPYSTDKTREIRRNAGGADILPVPFEINEDPEDQSRFDSYVWSVEKLIANYDKVIVLDARTKQEYDIEHLAGAVQAHWTEWSNVAIPQDNGTWAVDRKSVV